MTALAPYKDRDGVSVVYDGQCPFCTGYAHMLRLREAAGPVRLLDARQDQNLVEALNAEGLPINEGSAVFYGGRVYYGGDAIHILALLASENGFVNRWTARLLRSHRRAKLLYPALRTVRNLTLRVMGRSLI